MKRALLTSFPAALRLLVAIALPFRSSPRGISAQSLLNSSRCSFPRGLAMRSYTVTQTSRARLRAPFADRQWENRRYPRYASSCSWPRKPADGRAPAAPLNFFKNYFVTGDYRVYGVPIKGSPASGGFTTKDITIPLDGQPDSVPAGAELGRRLPLLVGSGSSDKYGAASAGAQFDGNDLAPVAKILNPIGTSPCWSSGGAAGGGAGEGNKTLLVSRADIVRFFDDVDVNGNAVVNGTTHTVKLGKQWRRQRHAVRDRRQYRVRVPNAHGPIPSHCLLRWRVHDQSGYRHADAAHWRFLRRVAQRSSRQSDVHRGRRPSEAL